MLLAKIDSLAEADFQSLIDNSIGESRSIEYKQALSVSKDSEKKEFLADVSSFANSSGGDLIFGIEEIDGLPTNLLGLENFSQDSEHLKVEEIIRNGLQPRIVGMEIRSVELENKNHILVIRVPQSINGPHMVTFKGTSKFYSRNSAGKYMLDVTELRSAFLASDDLSQKVGGFRAERIAKILNNETPRVLSSRNLFCMHLIPLESLNPAKVIDFDSAINNRTMLRPIYTNGWGSSANFDGLLVSSDTLKPTTASYIQLFRNGSMEAVNSLLLTPFREPNKKLVPSIAFEKELIEALEGYLEFYKVYGVSPPIVVSVSMLNVK